MQMTAGDELPHLLPRLRPKLLAFALRLCSDRHDAEDLLQRTCLRALERPHQLRPNTTPLSWMFSIMHTTWINELRARKIRSRCRAEWNDVLLDTVADPVTPTPEQNMITGQIIEAVGRLPEAQRIVMILIAFEGLSYSDAAATLGVPIGTVMSRLSRARQTLASTPFSVGSLRTMVGK
jgi:RNA polymerase sigma-70 factor (ECF subfamily)